MSPPPALSKDTQALVRLIGELSDADRLRLLALLAGQMAYRQGAAQTDATLRRIGDRLMGRPRVAA